MEAYRERIARRIREEAARHGESASDLAHEIGTHSSTAERWFRAERTPQRRHRVQLAEHWGLELDEFEPDLAADERALQDQLNRIEAKLDQLLDHFDVAELEELADDVDRDGDRGDEQTPKRLDEASRG